MIPPTGFECVRDGRTVLLVRSDIRSWMEPLLRQAGSDWAGYATRAISGGRGGVTVVVAAGHEVVVRPCRRGGLPARLLYDTYFGWQPRPFAELSATEALRQQGAPVVEVYGAIVRWLIPGFYRGWLATRYVPGAHTFWEWAGVAHLPADREVVFRAVGRAIRRLHDCGGRHPDLNLNNVLVGPAAADVLFIDFDRARTATGAGHAADADLARLRRSAHKLDPQHRHITPADLDVIEAAYREGTACR